jgi:nitronate monooxygenase/enoyl-[acyl-carrier protein] reductase II
MLHTRLCDLIGIQIPLVLAPFGPWEEVELAAAVSNAGGLGSVGTAIRSVSELREQWNRLAAQTDRPFAVNHTGRPLDEQAFDATLDFHPHAISFHMGVPHRHLARARAEGIIWIQTVGDLEAARRALDAGADVLIAQGSEAGGNSGWVATSVLVPSVVDIAGDTPVVAAGGVADGRGIAAALTLGAQGVCLGTRFLATTEMKIAPAWKQRLIEAGAEESVKVTNAGMVMPPFTIPQIGKPYPPRSLSTPLTEQLERDPDSVDPETIGRQLLAALRSGGGHDLLPFTGQSVALIHDIVPAAELMARLINETETALSRARETIHS